MGAKKAGLCPAFCCLQLANSGKYGAAETPTDLRQFYKRKFLNFNNRFNDCRIHNNPLSHEVLTVAAKATLNRSFGESEHALSHG
jgi:hypothetical protein